MIRELGSPAKVAESIKADYYGTEFNESDYEHKDYMEKYGQRSSDGSAGSQAGSRAGSAQNGSGNGSGSATGGTKTSRPWTSNTLKLILVIAIAIVLWPVTLGIALTVFGIVVAVV